MFYYYEKDNKILASQRAGLPYPQREPIPAAPIYYLVEGDPVLGRGSFKVNHPGQLKAPHGLEVLDASRLPEFPLDATLSAALEAGTAHRREHWPGGLGVRPVRRPQRREKAAEHPGHRGCGLHSAHRAQAAGGRRALLHRHLRRERSGHRPVGV